VLWVHAHRVAGGNAEEQRVKPIHVLEEAAPAGGHPPWCVGVGVVIGIRVPAVGRDRPDGVDAVPQQSPERFWVLGRGDAAAHADDGDGLGPLALDRFELRLKLHRQ
jgi:hypothetical protein